MTKKTNSSLGKLLLFAAIASVAVLLVAIPPVFAQRLVGKLTTTDDRPITVNGTSAASGASVLTGASIETPADVSATIDLGALGTVELQPKSKLQLTFNDNGNVRVKLVQGCAVTKKKKGDKGEGEVYTAEGASEKTNDKRRQLSFCFKNGKLWAK